MNLTDAPLGYAFEGDYPESYGDLLPRLQQVLRGQLGELDNLRSPARAAELLGILRGRRGNRQTAVQIDIRERTDISGCLLARGEIVMPRVSYQDRTIQRAVRDQGLSAQRTSARRPSGLVRLRAPVGTLPCVDDVLDRCGCQGAEAWPNYVMTMAAVGKGIGGPEPVQGPGRYAGPELAAEERYPTVAVIDTGIAEQDRGDGWLAHVARTDDNLDRLDVLPAKDGYLDFQSGHGTFVAGIVQRVAPAARVTVYRAADTDGFATDDEIADAVLTAFHDGAHIINLSLAGRTVDDAPPRGLADAVARVARESAGQVVIVAAAGNYADAIPCWPAALPGVEAVAGLTGALTPARWSSCGDVRFSTVAEGIRSTFVTGQESPVFDRQPETFGADAWALWSGTSFAAPQVAGAVARAVRELDLTPRRAVDLLDERGKPIPRYGKAMRILEGIR